MWLSQALSFCIRNEHKSVRANPFARFSGCSRSSALASTSLISVLTAKPHINNEPFLQLSGLVGGLLRVSFLHGVPQVPSGAPTSRPKRAGHHERHTSGSHRRARITNFHVRIRESCESLLTCNRRNSSASRVHTSFVRGLSVTQANSTTKIRQQPNRRTEPIHWLGMLIKLLALCFDIQYPPPLTTHSPPHLPWSVRPRCHQHPRDRINATTEAAEQRVRN